MLATDHKALNTARLRFFGVTVLSELVIKNRVTEMTGTKFPIIQAPMGWIARAQLASAVSNAGGLGIIETSSGELDNIKVEVAKMRELTSKPFGMNVALSYVKGTNIVDFVINQGIKFVTTSSGSPKVCTKAFQDAGITVFHVVPTLDMALKAIDAGVDGLIVEGGEGGGFKNPSPVSTMVLLPLIRSRVNVPIIAAGGISDGISMAGAFAMGAEGVQMGTRMLTCAES
ncbi:MAG: enoyl-[acyl-carrier protein] reductase II, partial [Zhongshania sp.]